MTSNIKVSLFMVALLIASILYNVHLIQENGAASRRADANIKAMNDSVSTYKDRYGRVVSEKRSLEVSKSNLTGINDSLKNVISGYKPEVIIKWKTKTEIKDSIEIRYDTIIDCKFSIPFSYKDKWSLLSGISTNEGLTFTERSYFTEQSLVVGYKRKWFLGENYASVKIVNSNPDVQVYGLESYVIKPKKTFVDKWYFKVGVGFLGGFLIAK